MRPPKKSATETRREVLQLLQTSGIQAAAEAAIAVCQDPSAPAPARATAAGLIFRGAALGGFGKSNEAETLLGKEPHEMSSAELDMGREEHLANMKMLLAAMKRRQAALGEEGELTDEDFDRALEDGLYLGGDDLDEEDETTSAFD